MEYHDGGPLRRMGDLPAMAAHRYGEKTAFVAFGEEQSYDELDDEANRVANVLTDHGVELDERVGLFVPNTLQFPSAYFGTIRAGAVPIPLNLRMDPETLAFVLDDADVDTMIASPLLAEEATELAAAAGLETTFLPGVAEEGIVNLSHELDVMDDEFAGPERSFDDVACQPYTSGTTGKPKGVLLTHRNLLSTVESYATGGLNVDAEDSVLLVLPLFHIYALNAVMGTFLYTGAEMVLQPQPEAQPMLDAIGEHAITHFAGVPAMYTMMHREYRRNPDAYDLSSLDSVTCAAAPLADATRREIEEAWDVPMTEGWGMTETSPAGTTEPSRGVRKAAGCIGPPVPNIECKIADPATRETLVGPDDLTPFVDPEIDFTDDERVTGEIAVRGPQVFAGYYERPEKTEQVFDDEGWFYTDDIARVDADGYFWMVDRADDMLIVGGENVYPAEVEEALYDHPDIAEAAVVAADHEVKGEAPVAFVVAEDGTELGEDALREFTLDHVASYAHPRRVFFVDELPRSATRKVQRYKLEADATERLDEPLRSTGEEF
ncbi:class I adenylate-forming enzyme family protein [Halococcus thailandensis]|uniref:Long-chain-fatty-acid--CoA ligase n=1 Tax=Halococcus thailandensis JCM 13552 TaxID=1227457 RepID=M0N1U2_9EURY|nr:AMP-binding protein [Halococcus thailandensis]EMA51483.1 long-chain-fatty-acid--CoA ligase [Halococcus thailandensis JCM 13552]